MTTLNKLFVHLQNQKILLEDLEGKQDFTLSQLKILRQEDKINAFQLIHFYKKSFCIMAEVDEHRPSFVKHNSFRPKNRTFEISFSSPLKEYFLDSIQMYKFVQTYPLSDEAIKFGFEQICIKHINEIGRMVDEDLYTYTDQIISMIKHITVQFYGFDLKDEYSNTIWIELRDYGFSKFKEYIYLSIPVMGSGLKLVKLTDY